MVNDSYLGTSTNAAVAPSSRKRLAAPGTGGIFAATLAFVLALQPAAAQQITFEALRASAVSAMGSPVTRIELSGAGWDACLGQAWNVNDGWARWELTDYRRVIDYERAASSHTAMRRPALDPERVGGCGAQPGGAASMQRSSIDAGTAWLDQLPIWLTPHGFLRLGELGETSVAVEGTGWRATARVLRDDVTYTVHGLYDEDFRLERIETWADDTVFGDMHVEALFGDYTSFGALTFPESILYKQGGLTTFELSIDGVVANTESEVTPPGGPRMGGGPPSGNDAPYVEIGDGIFVMLGAYQGVAVEFDDFAVVIDGLQNDTRAREMIELTHAAIPGKPIRYVVVTHSHFDHASGLRLFADEGATVLTHADNVAFFEDAVSAPRSLSGDPSLDRVAMPVDVQGVDGRFVIRDDAGQAVELHALEGGLHASDMLVAYLPSVKAVVESDLLQPWINPVFGGGQHPYLIYLHAELERLGLDYEQFVPIHQPPEPPMMPRSALEEAVGG